MSQCTARYGHCYVRDQQCDTFDEEAERDRQMQAQARNASAAANRILQQQQEAERHNQEILAAQQQAAIDQANQRRLAAEAIAQQAATSRVLQQQQEAERHNQEILAQQQAAIDQANQRRLAAEAIAQQAESRAREPTTILPDTRNPNGLRVKLALVVATLAWGLIIKLLQDIPAPMRAILAIVPPLVSAVIAYELGIDQDVTLAKIGIASLPYGLGIVTVAFQYHPHA